MCWMLGPYVERWNKERNKITKEKSFNLLFLDVLFPGDVHNDKLIKTTGKIY